MCCVIHGGCMLCLVIYSLTFINCCDRKSRAAYAQSFALRQQATIEIMRRNLSYHCLLAPRIHIFVLRAHPVRGESHNPRNTIGEVATTSPPFSNEPHWSHLLCVKAELGTTFTSWSQHHFVAIGNPERHMPKASHRGSKQQWRSCVAISRIISFLLHAYIFSSRTSRLLWITQSTQHHQRGCNKMCCFLFEPQ